jgi:hypothetical protein
MPPYMGSFQRGLAIILGITREYSSLLLFRKFLNVQALHGYTFDSRVEVLIVVRPWLQKWSCDCLIPRVLVLVASHAQSST